MNPINFLQYHRYAKRFSQFANSSLRYQNENDTTASHYHVAMHPTHQNQDLMLFSGTKKECVLLNDGQNAFIDSVIFISVPKRIIINVIKLTPLRQKTAPCLFLK